MILAVIVGAVFAQQLRVNLVPPRLGIGENAVEIENDYAEEADYLLNDFSEIPALVRSASVAS